MRLCRFSLDDLMLTGFYGDNVVIPIDQAAEAYSRDTGVELLLPSTESLLDLLPPDGCSYELAHDLDAWLSSLDLIARDELTISREDVQSFWYRLPVHPSSCSWPVITPSTSPSAEGQPPSGRRRFLMCF
jgi:hypothetical protein